jgi:hypothetical protein
MNFQIVHVAGFVGFVETSWKRVSAANACVSALGKLNVSGKVQVLAG